MFEIRYFMKNEVGAYGSQSKGDRVKDEPEYDRLWIHGKPSAIVRLDNTLS
jgi:hypothetical protein